MFIVRETKQNRLKPHRGGMSTCGADHAAPTELERLVEGAVTINMPLLRSWASVAWRRRRDRGRPNPAVQATAAAPCGFSGLGNSLPPRLPRSSGASGCA